MKVRNGFVSNSSSSSFTIDKRDINDIQQQLIKNHIEFSENFNVLIRQNGSFNNVDSEFYNDSEEAWHITEDEKNIMGFTWMDNFDMYSYFDLIGIDSRSVNWGE